MAQHNQLNARVSNLFAAAGFQTTPNSDRPDVEHQIRLADGRTRTVDLLAEERTLGVRIIAENTMSPIRASSFSAEVADLANLMQIDKAGAGVFIYPKYHATDQDMDLARLSRIMIWNEDRLRYYESLVDTIGEYAKFEIIHALGLHTKEEKNTHTVLAIRITQPFSGSDIELFLFSTSPQFLLKTSVVFRRAEGNAAAYQRILKKKRLDSVRRFVTTIDALLPPNIIMHLGPNVAWEPIPIPTLDARGHSVIFSREADYQLGMLKMPMQYASMELIDGQHRLFGFVGTDAATQAKFNLVVVGLKGLDTERKRDTFIAINDNARRMDPNLVAYLKHTDDEALCQQSPELMAIRVVVRLNEETPFRGRVRVLDVGEQRITLKGFAGYDLKGLVGKNGLLRKNYKNSSEDFVSALRLYFGVLKSTFPEAWHDPDTYIIFTNRGISAFLKLLKSILKTIAGPLTRDHCQKYLGTLLKEWKTTWETAKLESTYVGSQGWKQFHRDLVKAVRKRHHEFRT